MRADQPPFEVFDHTADVGLVARGGTLAEAFANAAAGMFSLMVDLERVEEKVERAVEVEADDLEGLLVAWLAELLFINEVDGLVFRRFDVDELSDRRLRARIYGEPLDLERHEPALMIKAVTRHQLAAACDDSGCHVRVIFDI